MHRSARSARTVARKPPRRTRFPWVTPSQLSPKSILDLHFGYTRYVYLRTPLSEGIDLSQFGPNWKALTPQMTYTHIPQVCVSHASGDNRWGGGWCAQGTGSGIGAYDDTYSFDPSFSRDLSASTL